jgi:hypothetical protein
MKAALKSCLFLAFASLTLTPHQAKASEYGCALILCLAASKPWDIKECVPTLKKFVREQMKPFPDPFPKCARKSKEGLDLPEEKEKGDIVTAPCDPEADRLRRTELAECYDMHGDKAEACRIPPVAMCKFVEVYIDGVLHNRVPVADPTAP